MTTMFNELLDSYDGLRKRTWKPSIIEEAFDPTPEQSQALQGIQQAFQAALAGTPAQGLGQQGNINFIPQDGGRVLVQAGNQNFTWDQVKFANQTSPTKLNHGSSNIRKIIGIWAPQQPETRYGDDAKQGFNGDAEGETGVVEPMEDAPQDDFKAQSAELKGRTALTLSDWQTDNFKELLEKQGLSEEEQDIEIDKYLNTVNTPNSATKYWKGLVACMGEREDLPDDVRQEFIDCSMQIVAMANQVEKVTLGDGSTVLALRAENITADMETARQVTTIRGEQGTKGMYFGHPGAARTESFSGLQDFTAKYDDSQYGTTAGNALSKRAGALWGVRILPAKSDPTQMSREDFDELEHATRRSTNVEARKSGMSNLGQRWRGLLTEDVIELNCALIAGDAGKRKEALETLKDRLQEGALFSEADIENLESVLLGDEFQGFLDFKRLDKLGVPPQALLRQYMMQAAVHTETFFSVAGISQDNVLTVERPSKESTLGYKSDIDIILKPGTTVSPAFKDSIITREDGSLMLSISVKDYSQLQGDTELGAASINKAYGSDIEHRTTTDILQNQHLERAVTSGVMTPEQADLCREALTSDRNRRAEMLKKFTSFTKANKADVKSYLNSLVEASTFETIEAKAAFDDYVQTIKKDMDNPRAGGALAAVKLFQLERVLKSQQNPEYAKAAAFNDAIFSCGTFDDEAFMRGSPGTLCTSTYHKIHNELAKAIYEEGGSAKIDLGGSHIIDVNGDTLFQTSVRAKTSSSGRKEHSAGILKNAGRKRVTEEHSSAIGKVKNGIGEALARAMGMDVEEEPEEQLVGSPLYPILQQLPSKETGQMQKVGQKIIVVHHPFCLKVKLNGHEFEAGYPSKEKALDALDTIRDLASEVDETIEAEIEDYDAGRTIR